MLQMIGIDQHTTRCGNGRALPFGGTGSATTR